MEGIMFKYILAVLMLGCCVFGTIRARAADDAWTPADTRREWGYQGIQAIDYLQTMNIARHPDQWHEYNIILGPHPSQRRVTAYFVSTAALHYTISRALTEEYRADWQNITIGFETGVVARNFSLGIRVGF